MFNLYRHFEKHRRRRPWNFCWRVTLEGLLVSVVVLAVLSCVVNIEEREFLSWSVPAILFLLLVVAPVFETLLLQALPITLCRLFRGSFRAQILASLIPFMLLHMLEGIGVGIGAGLIGGFYLAFTYAHWAEKSLWTALWTTTVSHFLRNLVPTVVLVVFITVGK